MTKKTVANDRYGHPLQIGDWVEYHGTLVKFAGVQAVIVGVKDGRLWLDANTAGRFSRVRPTSVTFANR